MRKSLFWLNDKRWLDLSRTCRPMFAVWSGLMIAGLSAGSCMFSRAAVAGAIARPSMAHT